jgi:hypothetical protein
MAEKTVKLAADSSALEQSLAELERLAELSPHLVNALFDGTFQFSHLFSIDADGRSTTAAGDIRIVLKPAPFLLGYMAAIVAFDR